MREQEHKEEEVVAELELPNCTKHSPIVSYKIDKLASGFFITSAATVWWNKWKIETNCLNSLKKHETESLDMSLLIFLRYMRLQRRFMLELALS